MTKVFCDCCGKEIEIDAVKVVRCKDCIYKGKPMPEYHNNILCFKNHQYIRDFEFFCADGKKETK